MLPVEFAAEDLLDQLGDAVVAGDLSGVIVYANPAIMEMLGWAVDELVGRELTTLIPESHRAQHLAGFERYQHTRAGRFIGGRTRVPALRKDGTEVEVDMSLRSVRGGDGRELVVAVLRDLSEVHLLARRNELLLGATTDGIYGLDLAGRVTFANAASTRLVGYTADELFGQLQHEVVHHSHDDGTTYDVEECPIAAVIADGVVRQVTGEVFWRADGSSFPVEYTAAPLVVDGERRGAVVTFRDVTEQVDAEQIRLEAVRLAAAETEHQRVIGQLQEAIMPPQPEVSAFELGVHYAPAGELMPTGGDLYDWLVLPDGDLHLCVVDVVGHGVEATKRAVAVIHAVRTLSLEGWPLDRLLEQAAHLVTRSDPELMATAVVARVDQDSGDVLLTAAGHPPSVVVRAAGGATELLESEGVTLGFPGGRGGSLVRTGLGPGDGLLLYTDGLVEAHKDLAVGIEQLRGQLGAAAGAAHHVTAELARALTAGATHHDDVLALLVRRQA